MCIRGSAVFYTIIIIDRIDQYCQGKMDCVFEICQVNQKCLHIFLFILYACDIP